MDFLINDEELGVLYGLPHIQQLIYLRGIRPYMDVQTGMVGIKRGISYQSIAEQLHIEPHPGIKSSSYSRAQIRRALASLERAGLITLKSHDLKLILKCELATLGYFVQNKPVIKPSQKADTFEMQKFIENKEFLPKEEKKTDIDKIPKAVPPLNNSNNYYIFLLGEFEKFWECYPLKKSKQHAWKIFEELNPSEALITRLHTSLQQQINFATQQKASGQWVANWKYPANWLSQHCWEDELPSNSNNQPENSHATYRKNTADESAKDLFWNPSEPECEVASESNVIPFTRCQ